MRGLLIVAAVVIVAVIGAMGLGLVDFDMSGGEAPEVKVEGGKLPEADVTTGDVDVDVKKAPEANAEAEAKQEEATETQN